MEHIFLKHSSLAETLVLFHAGVPVGQNSSCVTLQSNTRHLCAETETIQKMV